MIFYRGETIRASCEVRTVTAQLYDPTSVSVSVYTEKGATVINAQALSKDSQGKYSGSFAAAATWDRGRYRVLFAMVAGSDTVYDGDEFDLEVLPE